MNKLILSLTSVLIFAVSLAQTGTVSGTVSDPANGETLIGVSVLLEGTTTGTVTDFDGNYKLKLPVGEQKIAFSYISYVTQVRSVTIEKGSDITLNIDLAENVEQIGEVVIREERNTNTDLALMTMQRKSATVLDAVSSESFAKTGDSDAAAAIGRVTGVSVEGGKYVYVRGLGDRYTKTQLNGVDIPGLDPDRNTVQMDIFPSNLIDNIVIYKSFSPQLPGDFTGGMVNVKTKSFPSTKTLSFSLSLGYAPNMNLNKEGLRYKGSAGDVFAFGGGYRALPISESSVLPERSDRDPLLTEITSKFNSQLAPTTFRAPLNGSFSFASGNRKKKDNITFGYNSAINYSYQFRHFDDYEFGRSIKGGQNGELTQLMTSTGKRSEQEVSWSVLLGGAIKKKNSKYILNFLHSQNAVSRAAQYSTKFPNGQNTALPLRQFVLDYSQRSVSNALLAGSHEFKDEKWKVDWKLSPTLSLITEPDIRSTTYIIENGDFIIDNGDGAVPERFYRDLTEINAVGKMDVTNTFDIWKELKSNLSFGFANTYKTRDYQVLRFIFNNTLSNDWTGNGDELLEDENIWSLENPQGSYIRAEESLTKNPNIYQATQSIASLYVMNELPFSKTFKAIYGLRYERTDNWITGYGRFNGEGIDEDKVGEKVLNTNDFLPALNLVYTMKENMNIRTSYSRTIARPSFKEKSFVSILDPLSGVRFIGNIDLQRTNIENVDLRWEYFFNRGEMISVSGFYKHFNNPIELSSFLLSPNDVTPRNAGSAFVAGFEFETKKDFAFISEKMKNLSFNVNATYVRSMIDMRKIVVAAGSDATFGTDDDVTEYESRLQYADGEEIKQFRSMFGLSPFIVNAGLSYTSDTLGLEANVSYNVQGKRLAVVGVGARPDVYEQAFHSLNVKVSQKFGKLDRWKASLSGQNLIGDKREKLYESGDAAPQVFESFSPGRRIIFGISYKL